MIELLVVIAIIGILASIILVALGSARDGAHVGAGKTFDANVHNSIGDSIGGEWLFNECSNTVAKDSSGVGLDATLFGTSWSTDTPYGVGCSLAFNGTNSYASIPDSLALKPTAVTVSAWVKLASLSTNNAQGASPSTEYVIFKQNSRVSAFEGYVLAKYSDTAWTFGFTNAAGLQSGVNSKTAPVVGKWIFLVGSFSQPNGSIYVNGALEGTVSFDYPLDYGTNPIYIGQTGSSYNAYFNGEISDVRIYDRAVSVAEIKQLYAEGLPTHAFAVK